MTDIRYHSSDDMTGLGELAGVMESVAVVLRPDGSVDAYGYIGIVDQRPDAKARLLERAESYSNDAQKLADMPRLGQTSDAMTEEDCKTYAVMYRTIADEIRKVAASLSGDEEHTAMISRLRALPGFSAMRESADSL